MLPNKALQTDMAHLQIRPFVIVKRKEKEGSVLRAGMQERHAAELWRYVDWKKYQKGLIYSLEVRKMKIEFTAIFQKVAEGSIAFVEELPGANSQGDT